MLNLKIPAVTNLFCSVV